MGEPGVRSGAPRLGLLARAHLDPVALTRPPDQAAALLPPGQGGRRHLFHPWQSPRSAAGHRSQLVVDELLTPTSRLGRLVQDPQRTPVTPMRWRSRPPQSVHDSHVIVTNDDSR